MEINRKMHYLWRAVDHEGEALESFRSKQRGKAATTKFNKRTMERHGRPRVIDIDGLRSYRATMEGIGDADWREIARWANNRAGKSPSVPAISACDARTPKRENPAEVQLC